MLVVGLAPGLKGANRTGAPFVGDDAGNLLLATLLEFGLAKSAYRSGGAHDVRAYPGAARDFSLSDCLITNAVRCVPPGNKPTSAEISTCRQFLAATMGGMSRLRAILVLGRIAHDSTLRTLDRRLAAHPFAHGSRHEIQPGLTLFDSFHCSRYNVNTGRLTPTMFRAVLAAIQAELGPAMVDGE